MCFYDPSNRTTVLRDEVMLNKSEDLEEDSGIHVKEILYQNRF